jgi:hypothetical protein
LGHHGLHLVHLDDRVLVRRLEQQLEPLLARDLLGLDLHRGEVRGLQLLLREPDHHLTHVALDAVGRAVDRLLRRINLPAATHHHSHRDRRHSQ